MSTAPSGLAGVLAEDSPVMMLADSFATSGRELYLVGGPVRDALLGRGHTDVDLATDAEPEETLSIVEPVSSAVWRQGMKFGTVGCEIDGLHCEITTFRTEKYQPASRHPDVAFAADIKTDLSRRDFTINAMAIRLPDRHAVDPFGGREDLVAKMIRTPLDPRDSFSDDPLRMLRAFRFVSQLDFRIADDTLSAIDELNSDILTVSGERIRDELVKLLLGSAPARALALAESTGLTKHFLPELSALKLEQDPVHRHKDVFAHTLAVVERADRDVEVRVAALLHDIGKPKTRRIDPEGVSFHHHEVVGADMADRRLRELRFPNRVVDDVSEIIRLHHRFHTYKLGWSDSAVRRYVRDAGHLLGRLNALVRADCTTRNPVKARELSARMDELEARIAQLAQQEELSKIRPQLDGYQVMAYLGVPGGPVVGDALEYLLEIRLDEGILDDDAIYGRLDAWARERGVEPTGRKVASKRRDERDERE